MLQLKTPLSSDESEVLVRCLSDMEHSLKEKQSHSNQDFLKRTALASAKKKVQSRVYNCFYREEITNMVFALDSLSRKCSDQLSEGIPIEEATAVGATLRAAATTRAKLRRAVASQD